MNYFLKAQFEDIKKIVDQMWETLSENLKKVGVVFVLTENLMKSEINDTVKYFCTVHVLYNLCNCSGSMAL